MVYSSLSDFWQSVLRLRGYSDKTGHGPVIANVASYPNEAYDINM